jgi:eukaryotic-like serine/threonine-protein kinase
MNSFKSAFMMAFSNALAIVGVAGCLAGHGAAQSMFRGNPAHTGIYDTDGPRELKGIRWKFATGGKITSSPVTDGRMIYFGSYDFNVYAVDAQTGVQKWKYPTFGPVASTPAIADGIVYFMSYDGKFYAVDAAGGTTRWKFNTAGDRHFEARALHGSQPATQTSPDAWDMFESSPVVAQGMVFFGCGDGYLYALDAATGELRWKFATGDVIHASPAYDAGTIYVGSWDSYLYALDAASGKKKWQFKTGEDPVVHNQVGFQSSPAVVGGVVYVGCRDSGLYAIDTATGAQKWRYDNHGTWVIVSPAVYGGKVLFGTSDPPVIRLLEADSANQEFELKATAFDFSSPAVAHDVAYVGLLNGTFIAVDLKTGKQLWEFQTESSRRNDGFVLNADKTPNYTMLFRSEFEQSVIQVERLFTSGSVASSPLVMNGTVYFGSTDGYLYALD